MRRWFGFAIIISLVSLACTKDEQVPVTVSHSEQQPPIVKFYFKAFFNNEPLVYNRPQFYLNDHGDSVRISKFNYYISNIKLTKTDGSIFSENESYHLIKHDEPGTTSFTIKNVPEGNYDKIEFLIGVDAERNSSGAQTGDLDPAHLMFWDWNNGYIFVKLEGEFKSIQKQMPYGFGLHVGGFVGITSAIRKATYPLTSTLVHANPGKTSTVTYKVSLDEFFTNPQVVDLDSHLAVGNGKMAADLADNYMDMFTIDKIEN